MKDDKVELCINKAVVRKSLNIEMHDVLKLQRAEKNWSQVDLSLQATSLTLHWAKYVKTLTGPVLKIQI